MYSISSKLNSAFSTIGKATTSKITAKLVGKNSRLLFCVKINSNMGSCSQARLQNFEHICAFRYVSLPHLEWKFLVIELPVTFLSFGCLYLEILGFKSEQHFWTLDFCIFNLRRPRGPWFVCSSNIFYWILFSFYRTPEDRTKLALNLQKWKMIYLKIIGLFLSSFLCTTFIFLSLHCIISSGGEKIIGFLLFELVFTSVFRLYFLLCSEPP